MADEGYRPTSDEDKKKAANFFSRGNDVAGTGNFEYAIEMYLQGLAMDPEAVNAHQALRDISIKRKASGGKSLGMIQAMKLSRGKDDKEAMLNAEKLLSYSPGSLSHMEGLLSAAVKGGYYDTALWIGDHLLQANVNLGEKAEFKKYIALKDAYIKIQRWDKAVEAMKYAQAMRPEDMDLGREARDLSARHTMKAGGYEKSGSFRDSVRDMDKQTQLMNQDMDIRTADAMAVQIKAAEAEWQQNPSDLSLMMKLVDVLTKTDDAEHENRAIELLESAYESTRQYRYRNRVGQIKIQQLSRMERTLRGQISANPGNETVKKEYLEFQKDRLAQELAIYQEAAENYPTDMSLRYNVGVRLHALGRFDEAIPLFQQSRNDPKYRVLAGIGIGSSFLQAGFVDEAIDTMKELIDHYEIKTDKRYIEMLYTYGLALEKKGDIPAAMKAFSTITQVDFNFRDVQARLKRLRAMSNPSGGAAAAGG